MGCSSNQDTPGHLLSGGQGKRTPQYKPYKWRDTISRSSASWRRTGQRTSSSLYRQNTNKSQKRKERPQNEQGRQREACQSRIQAVRKLPTKRNDWIAPPSSHSYCLENSGDESEAGIAALCRTMHEAGKEGEATNVAYAAHKKLLEDYIAPGPQAMVVLVAVQP